MEVMGVEVMGHEHLEYMMGMGILVDVDGA